METGFTKKLAKILSIKILSKEAGANEGALKEKLYKS